jgi:hypothetical protein
MIHRLRQVVCVCWPFTSLLNVLVIIKKISNTSHSFRDLQLPAGCRYMQQIKFIVDGNNEMTKSKISGVHTPIIGVTGTKQLTQAYMHYKRQHVNEVAQCQLSTITHNRLNSSNYLAMLRNASYVKRLFSLLNMRLSIGRDHGKRQRRNIRE